jgi:hypothetical protein
MVQVLIKILQKHFISIISTPAIRTNFISYFALLSSLVFHHHENDFLVLGRSGLGRD